MRKSLESRRTEVGQCIWRARKKARFTGGRLAALTGISQSKISKIENGLLLPSPEDIAVIGSFLSLPEQEIHGIVLQVEEVKSEIIALRAAHKLGVAGNQQSLSQLQALVGMLEAQCSHLRVFETFIIPGLLQTREYARRIFKTPAVANRTRQGANMKRKDDIEDAVERRIVRQRILLDQDKRFEFIIMESALMSRRIFGEHILGAQIDRISAIQALPNVKIHFQCAERLRELPKNSGFHIYDEKLVNMEGTIDTNTSTSDDVGRFIEEFENLKRGALQDSRANDFLHERKIALSKSTFEP